MMRPAIIVLAKEPRPGRVKTRLCPPCSPTEAATLAEAALRDTLAAAVRTEPAGRVVLALDGEPGSWLPRGVDVIRQRGHGLAARLTAAFDDVRGPALLVGMDTPQLTPALLAEALTQLGREAVDAVLGLAHDGGWWAIGLKRPDRRVFTGVPMSTPWTGARQLRRLHAIGLRVASLPRLTDVDDIASAVVVARESPATNFARTLGALAVPA